MASLKELREEKVISQRDLADKSGVHWRTIYRFENGHGTPTFRTIRKLAAALDVDPEIIDRHPDPLAIVPSDSDHVMIDKAKTAQYRDEYFLRDKIESLTKRISILEIENEINRWNISCFFDIFVMIALSSKNQKVLDEFLNILRHWDEKTKITVSKKSESYGLNEIDIPVIESLEQRFLAEFADGGGSDGR